MTPRKYRGSAPVRFRTWVLPVVGGFAAGSSAQYVGAVAFAPNEVRCQLVDIGDSVSLWLPLVSPSSDPGRWVGTDSSGRRLLSPWSATSSTGPDATPSLSYEACSLPERVVWSISPAFARWVEWPRITIPYRQSDEVLAQSGTFTVWSRCWGL